jgi:hypothetical protein
LSILSPLVVAQGKCLPGEIPASTSRSLTGAIVILTIQSR